MSIFIVWVVLVNMFRAALKKIMYSIPSCRFGDVAFSYLRFLIRHRRRPTSKALFNDVMYRIKATNEIIDPLRVFVSDKEFVKLYVKAVVGDGYNVPTIAVIRDVDDVDDFDFPVACCIKPTQASGYVFLRKNGEPVDRACIKSWFGLNYYKISREANYKYLRPKIIVEPIVFENSNVEDYKFFCYNGVPKMIQVSVDRYIEHKRLYFDASWNMLDFSIACPKADVVLMKPENFEEMLSIAARLSAGFGFVRVDLYSDGKHCLVGEMTNCHGGADEIFIPEGAEGFASKIIFG